jgi:hypothetical protein
MNEPQHALTDSGEKSRTPRHCLVTKPCSPPETLRVLSLPMLAELSLAEGLRAPIGTIMPAGTGLVRLWSARCSLDSLLRSSSSSGRLAASRNTSSAEPCYSGLPRVGAAG